MLASFSFSIWDTTYSLHDTLSQYTVAMMGYGPEDKNTVLELTYNYGVKEYDKGNAYAQVAILSWITESIGETCMNEITSENFLHF